MKDLIDAIDLFFLIRLAFIGPLKRLVFVLDRLL